MGDLDIDLGRLREATERLSDLGERRPREAKRPESVQMGEGLMPMPRRLVERIQAGEFMEFAEFPVMGGGGGHWNRWTMT